ncbi:hypothetical protein MUK42_35633 [Musa troglodytarum]|uniref:Uncharacterized protein n=1 Tax=Musa troglodytarum TaxID=320322 RepID=A0A9E7GEI7_9LILI|nr:hypothetical protein MUK42_35633 [Musa troglodytarum]
MSRRNDDSIRRQVLCAAADRLHQYFLWSSVWVEDRKARGSVVHHVHHGRPEPSLDGREVTTSGVFCPPHNFMATLSLFLPFVPHQSSQPMASDRFKEDDSPPSPFFPLVEVREASNKESDLAKSFESQAVAWISEHQIYKPICPEDPPPPSPLPPHSPRRLDLSPPDGSIRAKRRGLWAKPIVKAAAAGEHLMTDTMPMPVDTTVSPRVQSLKPSKTMATHRSRHRFLVFLSSVLLPASPTPAAIAGAPTTIKAERESESNLIAGRRQHDERGQRRTGPPHVSGPVTQEFFPPSLFSGQDAFPAGSISVCVGDTDVSRLEFTDLEATTRRRTVAPRGDEDVRLVLGDSESPSFLLSLDGSSDDTHQSQPEIENPHERENRKKSHCRSLDHRLHESEEEDAHGQKVWQAKERL